MSASGDGFNGFLAHARRKGSLGAARHLTGTAEDLQKRNRSPRHRPPRKPRRSDTEMHIDQAEYERQYLLQLDKSLEDRLFSEKYSIVREQVELHRDQQRSWVMLRFQVSSKPDCSFARAGLVWLGRSTGEDPDWRAQLFIVHMWELLDARGWGLPPHCEPDRVTWLHPYGRPPWEPLPRTSPSGGAGSARSSPGCRSSSAIRCWTPEFSTGWSCATRRARRRH